MSDNNEDFMMSEEEISDFEFEDDEADDNDNDGYNSDHNPDDNADFESVDNIEEQNAEALYYKAKHIKQEDPEKSLTIFEKISQLHSNNNGEVEEYRFKALKQSLKIIYKLNDFDRFSLLFDRFFQDFHLQLLNKSYLEQSFNKIIDGYFSLPPDIQLALIESLITKYKCNEKLRIKLLIKKMNVMFELNEFDKILEQLSEIYNELENSTDNLNKNSDILEFYTLELQIYLKLNKLQELKEVYDKSLSIKSIIPHSKINAILKESSGILYLSEESYDEATEEFFESFKNYDEIGDNDKRIKILKYLILGSILNSNNINKFESQEVQFFLKNQEILKYLNLLRAFDSLKFFDFESQFNDLVKNESLVANKDLFLLNIMDKIFKKFKLKFLIHFIKPYKKLSLTKLSNILKVSVDELESIFLNLKHNNQLKNIKLDLISGILYNE
ncbi:hypothetical protein WICMUC_004732 [Wickerhamomyces mucosus]|uniref:PCI domain-containing protein n=1 Tax=Wickerhamomyces mucosus TaxID=1378264 RepID=A0A9P8PGN6_9ASCO|nr:hypothetical protein WICMUC_004732 [Wickerhamomyces mucosus]